jgi:hypothetical protein
MIRALRAIERKLFREWETNTFEEFFRVFFTFCVELHGDLETMWFYDIGLRYLWENRMFTDSEREVPFSIKAPP